MVLRLPVLAPGEARIRRAKHAAARGQSAQVVAREGRPRENPRPGCELLAYPPSREEAVV